MAQPENKLSAKMVKYIKGRQGWARKIPQGPLGAGFPDIVACYRGYGLWLETKMPGKERNLTPLQAEVLRQISAAGGIARVVTTVEQVGKILDAIDKKKGGPL